MAYRDAVEHIEKMDPTQVDIAAEELKRIVRLVASLVPTLGQQPGTIEWRADAHSLYERRLGEAIDLVEALHDGYDKAGRAVDDYVEAQRAARRLVAEGRDAEVKLGRLIAGIAATQSLVVQHSDPLRQWNDLRSSTGPTDWLIELGQQDGIDAVRVEADALFNQATDAYDRAIKVEDSARGHAVRQMRSALQLLPDFLADSAAAAKIIASTPGLADEVYQAATDPNARRPGPGVLRAYQVADDPNTRRYPDGWRKDLADIAGDDVEPRTLTKSEADTLDELWPWELKRFEEIKDLAFNAGDGRFPSVDQNDDHNDAFRHAYWNALLTREFGEDWAKRYATAHEAIPGNLAAREGMDLYNNEQGRAIAVANPDASEDELARLVEDAVRNGRTVVIDSDGQLAYSDQVRPEDTGEPESVTLPGRPQPATS